MAEILILYASVEGQAARIAQRMAQVLDALGHHARAHAADDAAAPLAPARYDGVMIVASVHYGHHPKYLRDLIAPHRAALEARPNAFFSVSLSGGGPGAKPASAQSYVDKFLRECAWQPQQTAIFGGALLYTQYPLWKRLVIRFIVGMAGGDTDMTRDYEYTDWEAVERSAKSYAQRLPQLTTRDTAPAMPTTTRQVEASPMLRAINQGTR